MQEIVPGVYHWTTFHEGIGQPVHSYYIASTDPPVVIDPRVPAEDQGVLAARPPAHAFLTNRHHYRHSDSFRDSFGLTVWCHRAGLHEFTKGEAVRPFDHGEVLPGGLRALPVGVLCPEETAFFLPELRLLSLGDAVIRVDGDLAFVPDDFMGEDPDAVRHGLGTSLSALLDLDFEHLLLAHGEPQVTNAKEGLRKFLAGLAN